MIWPEFQSSSPGLIATWPSTTLFGIGICIWLVHAVTHLVFMSATRFPGPIWARASQLKLRWHELMNTRPVLVESLHKQYGSLVQISPNELSVNDSSGIRQIFAPGLRLDRPEPLLMFHNYGSENMVSTVDGELHQERRKCVRSFYNIRKIEIDSMQTTANRCIDNMESYIDKEMGTSKKVNLFLLFRYLGCEFMSRFIYGEKYGLNLLCDGRMQREFQKDLRWQTQGLSDLLLLWFPHLILSLNKLRLISFKETPHDIVTGRPGKMNLQHRKARSGLEETNEMGTLFSRLASVFETEGPSHVLPNENYVLSEALDHFWAGVETTSDVLSAIVFRLSQPRNMNQQSRLRLELREAGIKSSSSCPLHLAKGVTYLECLIREGLRLHPPFKDSLTRRVSENSELTIHGYHIPPGMIIGAQPYSVHRNEDVFPKPEEWKPERWDVPHNSNEFMNMKKHLFTFGAGPRMCIGMNVAWNQLYLVLARIYSKYETTFTGEFLEKHGEQIAEWPEKGLNTIEFEIIEKM